jgi:hypothetical protein
VRHTRHYSVDEANALCDWIAGEIHAIRAARRHLREPAANAALERAAQHEGGGFAGPDVAADTISIYVRTSRLAVMDIVMRDLDRGLVDFPSLRGGQEVYLCWTLGEPSVGFWHDLDAGAAGRREL